MDKDATAGANSGTSWANAWTNGQSVVWGASGVAPGDTLFISGGSTNKTYTTNGLLNLSAHGASGNRITIRVGQDDGHNGKAIIDGSQFGVNATVDGVFTMHRRFITVDGAANGIPGHLVFQNWRNYTNKNMCNVFYNNGGSDCTIANVVVTNVNTPVFLKSGTNFIVAYNDLTAYGDSVMAMGDSRTNVLTGPFDSHLIFSNVIRCATVINPDDGLIGAPDGIQITDGASIFNNRFEIVVTTGQTNRSNHNDYFQISGNFNKIYNNEMINCQDSMCSPAHFGTPSAISDIYIYNNIFRITETIDTNPQFIRMYNTSGLLGYTNIHILNNLFVDKTNGAAGIYLGAEDGSAPGANNVMANNIFINVGYSSTGSQNWWLEKSAGAQSVWSITNNIMYHPNPAHARVNYLGFLPTPTLSNYLVAEWKADFDPTTGTNLPSFVRYKLMDENNDFHLNPTDTAAIDTGFDYSSVFTTDRDGNPRTAPWDRGPYEYVNFSSLLPCDLGPRTILAYSVAETNQISFFWPSNTYRIVMTVDRRPYTNQVSAWVNWTNIFAATNSPVELAGTFVDTNVTVGVRYEYQIKQLITNYVCTSATTNQQWDYQYISTGVQVPLVDERGNVILLVESGIAASLTTELDRLEIDLIGDGYEIVRHDVASVNVTEGATWTNAVAAVKALVTAEYNTDTNAFWHVFIVGNVPIPYSGLSSPGSHTENFGAHPADWYYADVDGTWTDSTANDSTADFDWLWNIPGDGKFDQSFPPSAPELRIGRINLRNMPAFGQTEVELLRQYLDRNHAWRHKSFTVRDRALTITEGRPFEQFSLNSGFFGNVVSSDLGLWLDTATNVWNSYLFSASSGAGTFTNDFELGTTADFADSPGLLVPFTTMHGSYYGDWDSAMNTNVVILAPLAADGYALTTYYHEQVMNYDFMSMSDPVGTELWTMAINWFVTESEFFNIHKRYHQFARIVNGSTFTTAERPNNYTSLMGDPTLRARVVAPPSDVTLSVVGSDNIISWTEANDENVQGYHVYRAPSNDLNDFTRLTSVPETDDSYTDTGGAVGSWTYMVRTVKLEDENSRSYYNASQGIIAEGSGPPPPPLGESGSSIDGNAAITGDASID